MSQPIDINEKSAARLFGEKVAYDWEGRRQYTHVEDRRNDPPILPRWPSPPAPPDLEFLKELKEQEGKMLSENARSWPWGARPETAKYNELKQQLAARRAKEKNFMSQVDAYIADTDAALKKINATNADVRAAVARRGVATRGRAAKNKYEAAVDRYVVDSAERDARIRAAQPLTPGLKQEYVDPRFYKNQKALWGPRPFVNSTGVPPGAWRDVGHERQIPKLTTIEPDVAGLQKKYPTPAVSAPAPKNTATAPATTAAPLKPTITHTIKKSFAKDRRQRASALEFGEKIARYLRLPNDIAAARQTAISSLISAAINGARGYMDPGYDEALDDSGRVISKRKRNAWRSAAEGALMGAGAGALGSYAAQTANNYTPEINALLARIGGTASGVKS